MSEEQIGRLVAGLREAVDTLYRCRYSEQPLAKKLDGLLAEITGKTNWDVLRDEMGIGRPADAPTS